MSYERNAVIIALDFQKSPEQRDLSATMNGKCCQQVNATTCLILLAVVGGDLTNTGTLIYLIESTLQT